MLRSLLVSREPLHGIGEWAARFVPDRLGLATGELVHLKDDRVDCCLDRLFDADIASLTLAVVAHALREFDVELDELHNDSTTVIFHGSYEEAAEETTRRESLQRGPVTRRSNYDKTDEAGTLLDRYSLCEPAVLSVEGTG